MGLSYLEILGIYLSSAGTLASILILGIFFGIYAKQNGKVTREFVKQMHYDTQKFIGQMHEDTQKTIKEMDSHLMRMDEHLVKMDEHADERHKEVIAVLSQLK